MDHSHSPHGAAVSSAPARLCMSHGHPPHGAAVSSASAQLRMAGSDDDGTPHARGRRGRRDNPPSHLHGAPSAMNNQPTSSRGRGDRPHFHPPHHEGMRHQSLPFSSERDGDINGLKTATSATFPTPSVGSSTKWPTASYSYTKRHPRLDDSYDAAPSSFNDLIRQYENAPTSFNTLIRQYGHASSQPLHTSTDIDNNHQHALSQPPHPTNPTISSPTPSNQHASSHSLQTMERASLCIRLPSLIPFVTTMDSMTIVEDSIMMEDHTTVEDSMTIVEDSMIMEGHTIMEDSMTY